MVELKCNCFKTGAQGVNFFHLFLAKIIWVIWWITKVWERVFGAFPIAWFRSTRFFSFSTRSSTLCLILFLYLLCRANTKTVQFHASMQALRNHFFVIENSILVPEPSRASGWAPYVTISVVWWTESVTTINVLFQKNQTRCQLADWGSQYWFVLYTGILTSHENYK